MLKSITLAVFSIVFSTAIFAQGNVKVGDEVQYQCFCFGQEWVKASVTGINGGNVRVRFGNLDNQVVNLPINSPKLKWPPPPEDPRLGPMRKDFIANAQQKYYQTVRAFASFYNPSYPPAGGPVTLAEWQNAMNDLTELDSLCRTRYVGINDMPNYVIEGEVNYRFGVWCSIAAQRTELEKRARIGIAKRMVTSLGYTDENLNFAFNDPDNHMRMETQDMIWNRDKWRTEKIQWLKPLYAKYGVDVPPDALDEAFKKADQLKAKVERDAPNRSWKQPPYHDASVESFVRNQFAKEYPGSQVVKIGLDYNTWVKRQSLTYVASDERFKYYKVNYNTYKRGTALLKIPGRPFCQAQEWVVGQGSGGLVAAGIGGGGTFMRCE